MLRTASQSYLSCNEEKLLVFPQQISLTVRVLDNLESQLPLDILMITKYCVTKQGDCSHFSLQESHQGVIQKARKLARKLEKVDSVTRPLRILCQSTLCVQGKMGQSCPLNSGRTQKLAHLFLRWNFRVLPNLSEVPTLLGGRGG